MNNSFVILPPPPPIVCSLKYTKCMCQKRTEPHYPPWSLNVDRGGSR